MRSKTRIKQSQVAFQRGSRYYKIGANGETLLIVSVAITVPAEDAACEKSYIRARRDISITRDDGQVDCTLLQADEQKFT